MKNTFLNLHEVILVLTFVETLFLCAFFKFMPSKQVQSRNFLALFFSLVAGTLITTLITWNSSLQTLAIANWSVVPLVLSVCLLLQGPCLYFYLRSLSEPIVIKRWINLVHLLPALLAASLILIFRVDVTEWLPWNWAKLASEDRAAVKFIWAIVRCAPLIYVLACLWVEFRLRQRQKQVYSIIPNTELRWAEIVLGGFFIHWLWSFAGYMLGGYLSGDMNDLVGTLNNYFTVILVNVLFIFGLVNTRQLLHIEPAVEVVKPAEISQLDEKIRAIERAIHQQKLYLESNINLERFAEQIGVRAREVSTIINSHYQSNFFEFINGYRVEEAKRLLVADVNKDDTILDIIYKSGFNSQSAFHRFFKRIVGVTPSEYRNNDRKEKAARINAINPPI
ncbi:MAG: AraC family transcriptional regulator [Gammaproteobacteria bacterium]|nr:MAG: AraC family transcriptional regulator [Gammaproteobacteria bacterium]